MFPDMRRRSILKLVAGTAGAAATGWLWSAPAAQAAPNPRDTTATNKSGALDVLVFGDPASETAHKVTANLSDIVPGGLGQNARVLNPASGFWGGTIAASMACRPKGATYVTIKLWGSDLGEEMGRLQLFVDGKQVGHYHLGAVDPLDIAGHDARSPGRFFLHTLPLPATATAGKSTVNVEIRSMGSIAGYAQTADTYYQAMKAPTRGIYSLYTHSDPFFNLALDDVVGTRPPETLRPTPGKEILDTVMAKVIAQADSEAGRTVPQLDLWYLEFLARAYDVQASKAYKNPAVPAQVASSMDAIYWRSRTDPKIIRDSTQQWMGLGRLGLVMLQLKEQIVKLLDEPVAGSPGVITNAGFEAGGALPSGWKQTIWTGSGVASRDTTVSRTGGASGKVTVPATGGVVGLGPTARIPVGPGTYSYGTWVKTEGVKTGGAYLDVLFFDAAGKLVGGDNKYYAAAGTNDWHQVTASLATPANATQAEVQVRVDGAGTAWFDDLTLQVPAGSALAPVLRRDAWATMLLESREYWRQNFPQYTNQAMICAIGLYLADRGLSLVGSKNAWGETKAREYIYQSVGLKPWLGPENADGTPKKPLGGSYFQVSKKGISRELGFAGNYGELQDWIALMFDAVIGIGGVDDQKLREHLVTMTKSRMVFRYPAVDSDGYKAVRYEAIVGWRDTEYPGRVAYDEGNKWDGHALKVVALLKDPDLTAYARQSLDDNQFFHILKDGCDMGMQARTFLHFLSAADDYAYVSGAPASKVRLPMMPDQPDFVFSDEENGVLAVKNGNEILYASLYWRARWGVNRLARIHLIGSDGIERSGTVWQNVQFIPDGRTHKEPNWVNWEFGNADMPGIPGGGFAPPGPALEQAFAGQELPLAAAPSDAPTIPVGTESPFAGRADFYECTYGPYLIAMNTSATKFYTVTPSPEFGVAVNLVTGQKVEPNTALQVAPGTTLVLRRR